MLVTNFSHVFAEPGEDTIIDAVHPETGRSCIRDETLEQIRLHYPTAELVEWEHWRQARAAEQDTPITWLPDSQEHYEEMLCVLPPAAWRKGLLGGAMFLVGEPADHSLATGKPRYDAYFEDASGDYSRSSRPITLAEFRVEWLQFAHIAPERVEQLERQIRENVSR